MQILPDDAQDAVLVGRIWHPEVGGPCIVAYKAGQLYDITSRRSGQASFAASRPT